MTEIRFTKLHATGNDFLLSWGPEVRDENLSEVARRICARTTGMGADGWILAWAENGPLRIRIFNSDGSEPEISGNGIRCAAAFGLTTGVVAGADISIATGAGKKNVRLVSRRNNEFMFEVDMGLPKTEDIRRRIWLAGGEFDATIVNVGNPQCAIFVNEFPDNWRVAAAEAEAHHTFPERSNVSFTRIIDRHSIETLFFERGAGETKSSGTGSTGAAVAAILRGVAESPVKIHTAGGKLHLRWDESVYLTGPAELIGEGKFFLDF